MIIKTALDEYAASLKKEFSHDRSKTVGASEIGACARRTYYSKHGYEAQDGTYGAALRGNILEDHFWVPALEKKYGESLLFAGGNQRTLADEFLSCTPDSLLVDLPRDFLSGLGVEDIQGDCILAECKTIDPRVDLRKEKEQHAFQVQVQLGLTNELTNYKPVYALISYIDASFLHEVSEFVIKFDPKIFAQAKKRAEQIMTSDKPEDLEPEGWILGGKECEYCAFVKQCNSIRQDVPDIERQVDPHTHADMTILCAKYFDIQKELEEAEIEKRSLQEQIKQILRTNNVRKIPGLVTWSSQKGRKTYDMKAMEAAGVDIEKFSTVGDTSDRLLVNYKG